MNHTEIELKLRLPNHNRCPDIFAGISRLSPRPPAPQTEHLESWYFDTPSHALRQAGVAYRLRLENDRWIATIKAGGSSEGGLHRRQEWNAPACGPTPSLEYFSGTEGKDLVKQLLTGEELCPFFSTVFDRQFTCVTTDSGDVIELAADIGWIIAGDRREPISEVELELKEGDAAAVLALGAKIARFSPLFIDERSKYSRGLALAGLQPSFPASPPPPLPIPPGERAVAALKTLLIHEVHHLFHSLEQTPGIGKQDLPSQLRKLDGLLKAAKPLIQPAALTPWIKELETSMQHNQIDLQDGRLTPILLEIWAAAARKDSELFIPTEMTWEEFASSSDCVIAKIMC